MFTTVTNTTLKIIENRSKLLQKINIMIVMECGEYVVDV